MIKKFLSVKWYEKKYWTLYIALISIGISFFQPLAILPMIGTIVFCAYYLPLGKRSTLTFRFVITLVVATCLHQVLGMLFWVIRLPLTVPLVVVFQMALGLLLLSKGRQTKEKIRLTSVNDAISVLASVASVIVILIFITRSGVSTNTLLRFSAPAIDDTVHLGLTMADYNNNGYIYGHINKTSGNFILPKLVSYPQGWHFSNSLWWHSMSNNLSTESSSELAKVLIAFTITKLAWYGLAIFMICKLILHLANFSTESAAPMFKFLFTSTMICFIQLIWFLQILDSGFSSLLPQMVYMLAITYIIYEFIRGHISLRVFFVIGSLLVSGLSLTWILTAAAGISALILGIMMAYELPYRDTLKLLIRPKNRVSTLCSVIIIILGLSQVFVQLVYSKGSSINEGGGILIIDKTIYILFLSFTIGLVYLGRKHRAIAPTVVAMTVGPALSAGILYLYQIMTVNRAEYYYYKLSWMILVILFVFFAAASLIMFAKLAKKVKALPSILSLGSLLLFYISTMQLALPGSDYLVFGWSAIGPKVAQNIIDNTNEIQASGPDNTSHIVVASNNEEEDIVAYSFMHNTINNFYEPGGCNIPMGSGRTTGDYVFYDFDQYTNCPTGHGYIIFAGENFYRLDAQYKDNKDIVIIK